MKKQRKTLGDLCSEWMAARAAAQAANPTPWKIYQSRSRWIALWPPTEAWCSWPSREAAETFAAQIDAGAVATMAIGCPPAPERA
jgi:hypothetical protein